MGRRIKSVIFTTDIAIIRSCNADAVLAVYPFTPQQVISQAIINVAPMPVFVGVGGGITNGQRSANIANDAEGDGAWGVVVNAPVTNDNIRLISQVVDIPIIATVINEHADIEGRLEASYPSSTTLLVLCVMPTTMMQLRKRMQNPILRRCVCAVISAFIAFMVVGRLISGVQWLTDIIGGILLSAGLVIIYDSLIGGKNNE